MTPGPSFPRKVALLSITGIYGLAAINGSYGQYLPFYAITGEGSVVLFYLPAFRQWRTVSTSGPREPSPRHRATSDMEHSPKTENDSILARWYLCGMELRDYSVFLFIYDEAGQFATFKRQP